MHCKNSFSSVFRGFSLIALIETYVSSSPPNNMYLIRQILSKTLNSPKVTTFYFFQIKTNSEFSWWLDKNRSFQEWKPFCIDPKNLVKSINPTIYNIIHWLAGSMGPTIDQPSDVPSIIFFMISYRLGHSKLFTFSFFKL